MAEAHYVTRDELRAELAEMKVDLNQVDGRNRARDRSRNGDSGGHHPPGAAVSQRTTASEPTCCAQST